MSVERYLNNEITPWTGEHIHRYLEAKKNICAGDVVLDLACGSGYGSNILSEVDNSEVYGGDIEKEAIDSCKKAWADNASLHFEIMDATDLRFSNDFFDKIVSLETIEHLTGYRKMLSEFSRVIKPNGAVIISTPNIKISSPNGEIINPYHTQEFTYDEFDKILKEQFSDVVIYGQKYTRYYTNAGTSLVMKISENLLLARGIRKLSYQFRNMIFKKLFNLDLYPSVNDFKLLSDKMVIDKKCHVLFAVCKK
jgi:2-polyprenyl-3-methyl-5-hydroxy-6-metoxy-1,4-benzoquinol methylase